MNILHGSCMPVACVSPASYFLLHPPANVSCLSNDRKSEFSLSPAYLFLLSTCLLPVSSPAPYSSLLTSWAVTQWVSLHIVPSYFLLKEKFKLNIYCKILLFCHFPDRLFAGWSGNSPVSFKTSGQLFTIFQGEGRSFYVRASQIHKKKLRCIIANLYISATINYQKISKKSIGMVEFVIPT